MTGTGRFRVQLSGETATGTVTCRQDRDLLPVGQSGVCDTAFQPPTLGEPFAVAVRVRDRSGAAKPEALVVLGGERCDELPGWAQLALNRFYSHDRYCPDNTDYPPPPMTTPS